MRLACLIAAAVVCAAEPAATLAVRNARIWTGDPTRPRAEAMAVHGERIIAVGSMPEVAPHIRAATRVIDAAGTTITPGFIDAHLHLLWYRDSAHPALFLRFLKTRAAIAEKVAQAAASIPQGEWILGVDWDESNWGGALPTRQWIDGSAPKHPVVLRRVRGTALVANSVALRLAGIDPATSDGLLRGSAQWKIDDAIVAHNLRRPRPPSQAGYTSDDSTLDGIFQRLLEAGITSVDHTGGWYDLLLLRRLHAQKRLPLRVRACPQLSAWERLRDFVAEFGRGDDFLRWDCLKGYGVMSRSECAEWVRGAAQSQLQVMVHVFEPPGLAALLDVYRQTKEHLGLADPRFRVEHAHAMDPETIRAFAKASAIASVQPPLLFKFDKPGSKYPYPWAAVREAGLTVAFGTDSVLSSGLVTPMQAIQMALERADASGQRLRLDEAFAFYTRDAAFARFIEERTGTLKPGMLADFVMFDSDLEALPAGSLGSASPVATVVNGAIRYTRPAVAR